MSSMKCFISACVIGVLLMGCNSLSNTRNDIVTERFEAAREQPDTITNQVMDLTAKGILTNVRITRSIPAQITATGPRRVLECVASRGSKWIVEANECEWMSEVTCTSLGGRFEPCESACRNTPNAEVCTMNCVAVCKF